MSTFKVVPNHWNRVVPPLENSCGGFFLTNEFNFFYYEEYLLNPFIAKNTFQQKAYKNSPSLSAYTPRGSHNHFASLWETSTRLYLMVTLYTYFLGSFLLLFSCEKQIFKTKIQGTAWQEEDEGENNANKMVQSFRVVWRIFTVKFWKCVVWCTEF